MDIFIREGTIQDMQVLQQLYKDTIMHVCRNDYDADQRHVWASGTENTKRWEDLLLQQQVFVAHTRDQVCGFSSLANGDYVDFMYVHKDHQRKGIAHMMYRIIEEEARGQGTQTLSSDVSKTARPFFEKKGFSVAKEQVLERKGVLLTNYKMIKSLI